MVGAEFDVPSCGVGSHRTVVPLVHSLGLLALALVHAVNNHDNRHDHYIDKKVHRTPTGIRTANRIIAVFDRPPEPFSLEPPSGVMVAALTLMSPTVPELMRFLRLFSSSTAALEPGWLREVTAMLTMMEPWVMEMMTILLMGMSAVDEIWLRKVR